MDSPTPIPPPDQQISAFSALNLLKNYDQYLSPSGYLGNAQCCDFPSPNIQYLFIGSNLIQVYHQYSCGTSVGDFPPENHSTTSRFPFNPIIGAFHPYAHCPALPSPPSITEYKSRTNLPLTATALYPRRPRGEKKPIPDDQKDDRYYERRKRNNQAAKKSRDARKFREDQIALRATLLEHENALLKAQVLTLREETQSLRQYILKERTPPPVPGKFHYGKSTLDE